jgi:hypothetical protein
VPLKTLDDPIAVLRRSLDAARLGHTDKVAGFKRLDRLTRAVEEQNQPLADFTAAITHEREISASLRGRTVFDDRNRSSRKKASPQLSLFPENNT